MKTKIIKAFLAIGLVCSSLNAETITHNGFTYGTVTSPYTGRVWLDRNLGASRVCTAYNDSACYGDYYQWGRGADGHQELNATATSTLATDINATDVNGSFIENAWQDWTTADVNGSQRSAYWSKTDGTSICPIGYRVPTNDELINEMFVDYIDSTDTLNNFLKIPAAGEHVSASYISGEGSYIIMASTSATQLIVVDTYPDGIELWARKGLGYSIRCVKEINTVLLNIPPVSNPGLNQTTYKGNPVTLSASNSTDSDGNITNYEWREDGTILSTDVNFTKYDFSVGVHTITLRVTDDANASSEANVTVTINDFPKETIYSNGTFTNSIDYLHSKRVYQFTLDVKSQVNIEITSQDFTEEAHILDSNNTIIATSADKYFNSTINVVLEAGTYTLEIYSKQGIGYFSFNFATSTSLEVNDIDFPKHFLLYYPNVSKELFDTFSLTNPNYVVSSDNLPTSWKIEKDEWDTWKVIIGDIPSDSFSVDFHVVNEELGFDKTYTTYFTHDSYKIDAIKGQGEGSTLAIKLDENNMTKPIALSFQINTNDITNKIDSVECYFGSEGSTDCV